MTNIHAPGGIRTQIPASARLQPYAFDRAATGIGCVTKYEIKIGQFNRK
jgi:hypothetical protein